MNEILENIESNLISGERILLKTKKLLRLRPDKSNNIEQWINLELKGYNKTDSISLEYMIKTNRWNNKEKTEGYWWSLSGIESYIEAQKQSLNVLVFQILMVIMLFQQQNLLQTILMT